MQAIHVLRSGAVRLELSGPNLPHIWIYICMHSQRARFHFWPNWALFSFLLLPLYSCSSPLLRSTQFSLPRAHRNYIDSEKNHEVESTLKRALSFDRIALLLCTYISAISRATDILIQNCKFYSVNEYESVTRKCCYLALVWSPGIDLTRKEQISNIEFDYRNAFGEVSAGPRVRKAFSSKARMVFNSAN